MAAMRTGKLAISRGHQLADPPHLSLVPAEPAASPVAEPAAPVSPDYHLVHDRLTALERLSRLHEQGALSADEFAAEKRLILGLPADELVLREAAPVHFVPAAPRRPQSGPSLVGRMLSWRFLLFSLVMGVGFSFAAQPDETIRFFDQTLRALGA
jgi:putative oligomerization/nucleic acid binding protein